MGEIEITRVENGPQLREFIELPYALYRNDPHWVAPLRIAQKELLDTRKHPFYANAEMQCFVARAQGRTAGRIAAILDHNFNRFQDDRAGFFGFFECIDSQAVADRLLHAAREWLRQKGVRVIRGPVNPSTNYECGLLVDGFDASPFVMMTYNPKSYPLLLEAAGLRKSKDLYAYTISALNARDEKAERVAARALKSSGITIRPINMKNFEADVRQVWEVYNSAWDRNWGFVPMTLDEFLLTGKEMKQILIPDMVLIGEVEGRAVGMALALPDINQALKHAGGRLFPFGLMKILYHQRKIRSARVMALGVVEEFRTAGVAAGFYSTLLRNARRLGYGDCESSWVLEDNVLMNRSLEALGAKRYKTYRIYEWN